MKYLLALGINMVRVSWITESLQNDQMLDDELYHAEFAAEDQTSSKKFKQLIESQHPRLLSGLFFYLTGTFRSDLKREHVTELIKMCGGQLVKREPDPEWIPPEEISCPHHAQQSSTFASTSHIILYDDSREPLLKYNMAHIKTLPLSWLVDSVKKCKLFE